VGHSLLRSAASQAVSLIRNGGVTFTEIRTLIEETRSLTPQQVIEDFSKDGIELTYEQAMKYIDLIYYLARLVVDQNFMK